MTICKRINKIEINITKDNPTDGYGHIIMAIDSTGTKVIHRVHWMDKKWNVQNRRCYIKIHVAVNINTKEILDLEVKDEKVHDGKMLNKLVNHVLDNSDTKIESLTADGAHYTNTNSQFLERGGIIPGMKVRNNSIVSSTGNKRLRNQ